jgi:L-aminopeptidase/D-esterase-like protein
VAPTADDAYRACRDAVSLAELERGQIGAGTGATTNKLLPGEAQRGGFGIATRSFSLGTVTACVVVNAAGNVFDTRTGQAVSSHRSDPRERLLTERSTTKLREATTLAALLIDAPVDEVTLVRAAIAAHDGMARSIRPCHTLVDGDVVFACALQSGQPDVPAGLSVAVAAELAIEAAILDAVTA